MVVFFGSAAAGLGCDVPDVPAGPGTYAAMPAGIVAAGLTRTGCVLTRISTISRMTCSPTVTAVVQRLRFGSPEADAVSNVTSFILRLSVCNVSAAAWRWLANELGSSHR